MSECVLQLQGLEELKSRLESLSNGKLAKSMMRTGAREAAKVLLEGQRSTVPVESGKLMESLGIQVKGGGAQVLVGADVRWNYIGRFHEFGTRHLRASHWTQRAWDETSGAALNAYETKVRAMLDKKEYNDLMAAIEEGLSGRDE